MYIFRYMNNQEKINDNDMVKNEQERFFVPILERILADVPERSRVITRSRFGIDSVGQKPQTLEAIGQQYDITRERVRQILRDVFFVTDKHKKNASFDSAQNKVLSLVDAHSGIIKEDRILAELGGSDPQEIGAVRFFVHTINDVDLINATPEMDTSVVRSNFDVGQWKDTKERVKAFLAARNEVIEEDQFLSEALSAQLVDSSDVLLHYLDPAREIMRNPFGKWGLVSWPLIRPRNIRDKVYLILLETGTPLHFLDIAHAIDQHDLRKKKKRPTHPQTVHNELIKDARFVLVGRGTYALAQWGYQHGTVRDVIIKILETQGSPMSADAILTEVLKVRDVKRSTVMINLKTNFVRTSDGLYTIA
ncbi:MAG: hypothetical protein KC736_03095 [Candidatus Moranbacteria bacterium]|nr:hypothetical protein [Candidatus Moranbacteria bacterium]